MLTYPDEQVSQKHNKLETKLSGVVEKTGTVDLWMEFVIESPSNF